MCRINSTSAYYKASTKSQIQHKNSTNTQKTLNRQNKNNMTGQKQYKRSAWAKTLNPEKNTNTMIS